MSSSNNIRDFFSTFAKSNGGFPSLIISILLSFGIATTVGIVPAVLSDRYARLYHGYTGQPCSSYEHHFMPVACMEGGDDAQTGSAWMALVQNLLLFICNPLVGSQSDMQGRRNFLIVAILLFSLAPAVLVMMQRLPNLDPFWYYAANSSTGFVSYMSLIFAALSDSFSEQFRAASFAAILAGFYSGFSLAPTLVLLMSHESASILSFLLCLGAFLFAVIFFPETLPESVAAAAVAHHSARTHNASTRVAALSLINNDEDNSGLENVDESVVADIPSDHASASTTPLLEQASTIPLLEQERTAPFEGRKGCTSHRCCSGLAGSLCALILLISRPFREMSILSRNKFLRLVTLSSFLSAMVYSTDVSLVLFYIEEHLNVHDSDISSMFFVMGILGVLMQTLGLQPLVQILGERGLLILCFLSGTLHNFLYGAAKSKTTITWALSFSQLTKLSYPILSSMASQAVCVDEQGQIQGALLATNALAGAVGPVSMNFIYEKTKNGRLGPGTMFLLASGLYFLGTLCVCMIPPRQHSALNRSLSSDQRQQGDIMEGENIILSCEGSLGSEEQMLEQT